MNRRTIAIARGPGFTLLELLVVLVVIAIGTSLVSARLMPDNQRLLDQDAERLAQILSVAQEFASVRAETLIFSADETGFQFGVVQTAAGNASNNEAARLLPVRDDLLGPRKWQLPQTRIRIETDGLATTRLPISPEPGLNRTLIELRYQEARSLIVRRFSGRYQIIKP